MPHPQGRGEGCKGEGRRTVFRVEGTEPEARGARPHSNLICGMQVSLKLCELGKYSWREEEQARERAVAAGPVQSPWARRQGLACLSLRVKGLGPPSLQYLSRPLVLHPGQWGTSETLFCGP